MIITDGAWHRIGFAWDGVNRTLYIDDVPVTEDSQSGLAVSFGGLNIGCGKNIASGRFWHGLIDAVRINNRGVRP